MPNRNTMVKEGTTQNAKENEEHRVNQTNIAYITQNNNAGEW